ncbi:hypothetical protein QYF36_000869 [Acer negundo]|nr:hypothetical protein QYF36_000869 [Acer negundo]
MSGGNGYAGGNPNFASGNRNGGNGYAAVNIKAGASGNMSMIEQPQDQLPHLPEKESEGQDSVNVYDVENNYEAVLEGVATLGI